MNDQWKTMDTPTDLLRECLRALNHKTGFTYPGENGERNRSYDLAARIDAYFADNSKAHFMARLNEIEMALGAETMDAQERAETYYQQEGIPFDDYTEDDEGNPVGIVYPENAAPELDLARSLVQQAMEALLG